MAAKKVKSWVCPSCKKPQCECGYCDTCQLCGGSMDPAFDICSFCQNKPKEPPPEPEIKRSKKKAGETKEWPLGEGMQFVVSLQKANPQENNVFVDFYETDTEKDAKTVANDKARQTQRVCTVFDRNGTSGRGICYRTDT